MASDLRNRLAGDGEFGMFLPPGALGQRPVYLSFGEYSGAYFYRYPSETEGGPDDKARWERFSPNGRIRWDRTLDPRRRVPAGVYWLKPSPRDETPDT
jgi:hypothetical protein